jgi:D-alanyl-D-alanine carboxypeptidase/D-alanyl-D-alanine-endopeptidase (penicillin-binding protein 4)
MWSASIPLTLLAALLLTCVARGQTVADPLQNELLESMRTLGVPTASVSILIRELDTGNTIVSLNPDVPRNPASVMKAVTTFAALDRLGPGYRWRTEALSRKKPDAAGRIQDLYFRGQGNPYWVAEDFEAFVRAIYARGVRHIDGDLVLDRSYYASLGGDRAAFDGKPYRVYNVLPDPLTMNFGSLSMLLVPNVAAHRLDVQVAPPVTTLEVDNRIKLQRKSCTRRNIRLRMNVQSYESGPTKAVLSGEFPNRCREFELVRVVLDEVNQVVGAFEARWQDLGGEWSGGMREEVAPADAIVLYEQPSRPLGDVIRSVNKFSNNVMARQIFLTLGAEDSGEPATLANSRAALLQTLRAHAISSDGFFIDNGSGLSRDARLTATTLVELMSAAWQHRYGTDFFSALPVPGVDGTLEARFDKGSYVGQAHIKTGTLDHVTAMSGLVQARGGQRYLVAFMVNHHNVHKGSGLSLQKKLLRLLVERDARPGI